MGEKMEAGSQKGLRVVSVAIGSREDYLATLFRKRRQQVPAVWPHW